MTMRQTLRKVNDWSQLDAQLIELWADHSITTREIGDKLGVSKNAVIGRAHRLHLPARPNGFPWLNVRTHAPRPTVAPRPKPEKNCFSLLDLSHDLCHWPVNSPARGGEYLFCGNPVETGSYCPEHAAIGFSGKGTARATERAGWQPRQTGF